MENYLVKREIIKKITLIVIALILFVLPLDGCTPSKREREVELETEAQDIKVDEEELSLTDEEKLTKLLSGKKLSVLGDSISTFVGFSNNTEYNATIGENAVWYDESRENFTDVNETWWMQAINKTNMVLNVNNSWSGDHVTKRGVARSLELHNNENEEPDIIAVYVGINDFRWGKTVDEFEEAYDEMIRGMKQRYANAEIFLFTLVYTTNVKAEGVIPEDVVEFNNVIEKTADVYDCALVDLYHETGIVEDNLSVYMIDETLHPNYTGMDCITECFMKTLIEEYVM